MGDVDFDADGEWWTPEGWKWLPKPPAAIYREDDRGVLSPDKSLFDLVDFGGDADVADDDERLNLRVKIQHSVDALIVRVWAPEIELACFFVHRRHEAQFFVDKLPALLAGYNRWIFPPRPRP